MKTVERKGTSRQNVYVCPPEDIFVVPLSNKDSAVKDERVTLKPPEWLIASIMQRGVIVPLICRKNGDRTECVDGRQRIAAAIEANKRLAKQKKDPVRVRYVLQGGEDKDHSEIMVIANEYRVQEPPTMRAAKMQRYLDKGYSMEEVASLWRLTPQACKQTIALLQATPKVKAAVDAGDITEGAARELVIMPREEQDDALGKLSASGHGRGVGSKKAARDIRKTGKTKKKNNDAKKMKPRHWVEGLVTSMGELEQTRETKLAIALANRILGDVEALEDFPAIGSAAARVNKDGSLVDAEDPEETE